MSTVSELTESVVVLAEQFSASLNFTSINAMKETARALESLHSEQNCTECSGNLPDAVSIVSSNIVRATTSSRKSRKSCVLPKFISSSESEADVDDDKSESMEKGDESPLFYRKKKVANILSDDETVIDDNEKESHVQICKGGNVSEVFCNKQKSDILLSDSGDEFSFDEKSVSEKVHIVDESSCDEKESVNHSNLCDSFNNAPKKDEGQQGTSKIIEKTDGEQAVIIISSEEEDFESFVQEIAQKRNREVKKDSDDDIGDFIVPDEKFEMSDDNKEKQVKYATRWHQTCHANRNVLGRLHTPKSVLGTPAYKREFNKIRDNIVKELFELFNTTVFDNKLPSDFEITWNNRMTKTAGFCYYSMAFGSRKSRIELSSKVLDCVERVRDTLIHELCHAATWLIDGEQAGHGRLWKSWARKASKAHPDLPIINRCHQYEIHTKYKYICNGCGLIFGRHSKSIDALKHRCAQCGGIPELETNNPKPNKYALFVKENFAMVKKQNPGVSHKEIMAKISKKFNELKMENKENE